MTVDKKIEAFSALGQLIRSFVHRSSFDDLARQIQNANNWFTTDEIRKSFSEIGKSLTKEQLRQWLERYDFPIITQPKKIGILMAGNIPAVGFHDLLSVLVSGHQAHIKLSSTDAISIRWIVNELREIAPELASKVHFEEMLNGMDAYIATGSDNSSRYFDYYFGKYPHIIRKNRTSVAVLKGDENPHDFQLLGKDIFQYYGLGCRNVSKIFVPNLEIIQAFLDNIQSFDYVGDHHKYFNNYEYNKSILLVNNEPHLDNGFLLMQQSEDLVSPISMIYYELYSSKQDLYQKIDSLSTKIQVIVSKNGWFEGSLCFGEAQCPSLSDYADNVDTVKFLIQL